MRVGCLSIAIILFGFVSYGLYISWGIRAVLIFAVLIGVISSILYFRIKNISSEEEENEEIENDDERKEEMLTNQPVLQDPDSLLAQFREQHSAEEGIADEEEAFERAVQEVKNQQHAEDSERMNWIRTFDHFTERFVQRAQLKTKSPLMKRLNVIFILNGLLYVRVFVNLVEIAQKMERLPSSMVETIDRSLSQLSKQDYERLNRMIALHYVDLFISDHTTSLYFDDTFTKRNLTSEVMEGLSFSKQETLLLQGVQTDTQYIELMFDILGIESNKSLIDLAKTAFENTKPRMIERVIAEIERNQAH